MGYVFFLTGKGCVIFSTIHLIQGFIHLHQDIGCVVRDVKLEYKILKEKVREYNKTDAQFYGSIFAKMKKLEQARSAVSSPTPTFINIVFCLDLLLQFDMSLKSFISDCFCVLYEQNTPRKQEPVPMIIDSKV